jgi:hypothetical protein
LILEHFRYYLMFRRPWKNVGAELREGNADIGTVTLRVDLHDRPKPQAHSKGSLGAIGSPN